MINPNLLVHFLYKWPQNEPLLSYDIVQISEMLPFNLQFVHDKWSDGEVMIK